MGGIILGSVSVENLGPEMPQAQDCGQLGFEPAWCTVYYRHDGYIPDDIWKGCTWHEQKTDSDTAHWFYRNSSQGFQHEGRPSKWACHKNDSNWHLQALGPFLTDPGATIFSYASVFQWLNQFPMDITSWFIGYQYPDGTYVEDPPIKNHHTHFSAKGNVCCESMSIHQDDQCAWREGGAKCNWVTLPKGYAVKALGPNFMYKSWTDDIRQPGPAHSRLKFYNVVAIMIAPTSTNRPLSRLPVVPAFFPKMVMSKAVVWSKDMLRNDLDSPVEVKLAVFNGHDDFLADLLVFQGGNLDMSNAPGGPRWAPEGQMMMLQEGEHFDQWYVHMMGQAVASGADLVCRIQGHRSVEDVYWEGDKFHKYRKTMPCKPFVFDPTKQDLTFVTFVEPQVELNTMAADDIHVQLHVAIWIWTDTVDVGCLPLAGAIKGGLGTTTGDFMCYANRTTQEMIDHSVRW